MHRKIIQIAVTTIPEHENINAQVLPYCRIYALCDDGSLWWRGTANSSSWKPVQEQIPQEPSDAQKSWNDFLIEREAVLKK